MPYRRRLHADHYARSPTVICDAATKASVDQSAIHGYAVGVVGSDGITASFSSIATTAQMSECMTRTNRKRSSPHSPISKHKLGNYCELNERDADHYSRDRHHGRNAQAFYDVNSQTIALKRPVVSAAGDVNEGTISFQILTAPHRSAIDDTPRVSNGTTTVIYVLPRASIGAIHDPGYLRKRLEIFSEQ